MGAGRTKGATCLGWPHHEERCGSQIAHITTTPDMISEIVLLKWYNLPVSLAMETRGANVSLANGEVEKLRTEAARKAEEETSEGDPGVFLTQNSGCMYLCLHQYLISCDVLYLVS